MLTATLTRTSNNTIPVADRVVCTMSDGTNVMLDWRAFAACLGEDLVPVDSPPQHVWVRRIPTDSELTAARHR